MGGFLSTCKFWHYLLFFFFNNRFLVSVEKIETYGRTGIRASPLHPTLALLRITKHPLPSGNLWSWGSSDQILENFQRSLCPHFAYLKPWIFLWKPDQTFSLHAAHKKQNLPSHSFCQLFWENKKSSRERTQVHFITIRRHQDQSMIHRGPWVLTGTFS